MRRRGWTLGAVALLVAGVALFLSGPRETSFVIASSDSDWPTAIYWLPWYRLLGVATFVAGLIVLAVTTAYAVGLRRGRSAAN
jgi:uncharacterized BrkB/YihY/UPF0761 family membrane protein